MTAAPSSVLCFGDSLTEGYFEDADGLQFHPYSSALQQLLKTVSADCKVDHSGVVGDKACDMLPRLSAVLDERLSQGVQYDAVVIFGGINDVYSGYNAERVLEALYALAQAPAAHSCDNVLLFTLCPPARGEYRNARLQACLKAVNKGIRAFCQPGGSAGGGQMVVQPPVLVDLARAMDSVQESAKAPFFSEDDLHPAEAGYDFMAMLVFETLLRAMPSPPANLDQARVVCCKGHPSARRAAATWNLYQWRAANADAGLFSVDDCLREWLRVDRQGSDDCPAIPTTFVVEDASTELPLGTVTLEEDDLPARPDLTPWMTSLYVRPDCRGRGLGKALVRHAVAYAKRLGLARLYLWVDVHDGDGLIGFYKAFGWKDYESITYLGRRMAILVMDPMGNGS